jgi:hypothetical protein
LPSLARNSSTMLLLNAFMVSASGISVIQSPSVPAMVVRPRIQGPR